MTIMEVHRLCGTTANPCKHCMEDVLSPKIRLGNIVYGTKILQGQVTHFKHAL